MNRETGLWKYEICTSARDAARVTLAASLAAMGSPCWDTRTEKRGCSSESTAATADEADAIEEGARDLQISSK
jgi:hypothetical protein